MLCYEPKLQYKKKNWTTAIGDKNIFHHRSYKQEVLIDGDYFNIFLVFDHFIFFLVLVHYNFCHIL